MRPPRLKWWAWGLIGFVGIGLVGAIVMPPDEVVTTPDARASTSQTITTNYVERAFDDGAALALRKGKGGEPLSTVAVRVKTTDAYGNSGEGPLLTLTWTPDDLARVNWREIDRYRLLDLAGVTPDNPDAMLAFHDWCWADDASGPALTPRFCASPGVRGARDALSGQ